MILLDTNLLVRMTRSNDPLSGVARAAINTLLGRNEPHSLLKVMGAIGRAVWSAGNARLFNEIAYSATTTSAGFS
jgi:hypothetical protein